jgi:methylthioribose-1-phosphate isomerase
MISAVRPIEWNRGQLRLLDQRVLPQQVRWLDCHGPQDVAAAIHDMAMPMASSARRRCWRRRARQR